MYEVPEPRTLVCICDETQAHRHDEAKEHRYTLSNIIGPNKRSGADLYYATTSALVEGMRFLFVDSVIVNVDVVSFTSLCVQRMI